MTQPDLTLYPHEEIRLNLALEKIQRQFEFTKLGETDKRIFEMAAHTEFGEAGFLIDITWQQIYQGIEPTGVWLPGVEVTGRNKAESEHDHDRHRWDVVKGLADGQPGYVREDGTKHEEPIKKIIT